MSTCIPQTGSSSGAMGRVGSMPTSSRVLRFLSSRTARLPTDGPPAPPLGGRLNRSEHSMDEFLTPPEPVRAVVAQRPTQASLARIGLIGIAAAALLAVALLAFGSSLNP